MRVFIANSCVTSGDEFIWHKPRAMVPFLKQGELQMVERFNRISFCSLAFILLAAGSLGVQSFAAATAGQDNANRLRTESGKRLRHASPRRQVASTKGSKHRQRTIIFVGGKKGSQGAATKSNPTRAIKSNGTLNPQPIPPGKQRPPE
jgi:hypothetical protein